MKTTKLKIKNFDVLRVQGKRVIAGGKTRAKWWDNKTIFTRSGSLGESDFTPGDDRKNTFNLKLPNGQDKLHVKIQRLLRECILYPKHWKSL